ncbi:unnamed protein product, partial [Medioppia subpectinata]
SLPKTREGYIGHVDADIHAEAIASTIPGMSAADIDTQALPILRTIGDLKYMFSRILKRLVANGGGGPAGAAATAGAGVFAALDDPTFNLYLEDTLVSDKQTVQLLRDYDFLEIRDHRWSPGGHLYVRQNAIVRRTLVALPANAKLDTAAAEAIIEDAICGPDCPLAKTSSTSQAFDSVSPLPANYKQSDESQLLNAEIESLNRSLASISKVPNASPKTLSEISSKIKKINEQLDRSLNAKTSAVNASTVDTTVGTATKPAPSVMPRRDKQTNTESRPTPTTASRYADARRRTTSKPKRMSRSHDPSPRVRGQWMCCLCDEMLTNWKAVRTHLKPLRCAGFDDVLAAMDDPEGDIVLMAQRVD